jgi:hypothetical protein
VGCAAVARHRHVGHPARPQTDCQQGGVVIRMPNVLRVIHSYMHYMWDATRWGGGCALEIWLDSELLLWGSSNKHELTMVRLHPIMVNGSTSRGEVVTSRYCSSISTARRYSPL